MNVDGISTMFESCVPVLWCFDALSEPKTLSSAAMTSFDCMATNLGQRSEERFDAVTIGGLASRNP